MNKSLGKQISPLSHQGASEAIVLPRSAVSLRQSPKRNNNHNHEWASWVMEHHLDCCSLCEGVVFKLGDVSAIVKAAKGQDSTYSH